jgi:predicted DNA-binding transcriptional regulator AlpA
MHDDLDPFIRKPNAVSFSGMGMSEFHQAMKNGKFPKPDAYLGERSPVWRRSTLVRWQADILAQPQKPTVKVGTK